MERNPVVAGSFYPSGEKNLRQEIKKYFVEVDKESDVIGLVVPHAGYIYSGKVAGAVYSKIKPADNYVILGPNHTGMGSTFSIDSSDKWITPLGKVEINKELSLRIQKLSGLVKEDSRAHMREHSIEVQVPFLQFIGGQFKIVPIVISHSDLSSYRKVGKAISTAIGETMQTSIVIASTDMTHYEPETEARRKDSQVLSAIEKLDEEEMLETVRSLRVSMCGYAPTAITIFASKEMGAAHAEKVLYNTSGETSLNYDEVVGYGGVILKK